MSNELQRFTYIPKVTTFITKVEYSYGTHGNKKITERITFTFASGEVIEYYEYFDLAQSFEDTKSCTNIFDHYHVSIKGKFYYKIIKKAKK